MKELEIRYSNLKDLPFLEKWLKDPDNNKWFPCSLNKEIEESAKNWISFYRYNASLTGLLNNQVCAIGTIFLMPYRKLAHHAMFYLIVDKNYRNKGIGSDMLKNLMNLAQNYFKLESIYTEVFEGCLMIDLLKKFKFEQFAYQPMYIKEDKDKYLARILFNIWFN
jgi:RimJ/RimL family protein N-acetyltransferase